MAQVSQAIVGFDLGGTKMMAAVFDQRFKIIERSRKRTKPEEGPDLIFQNIVSLIREALEEAKVSPRLLRGIGIGCPGPVDAKAGVLLYAPNIGWKNFPLAARLSKIFSVPVALENDVNLGTYSEYCFGAVKGMNTVIGVFPGTGIGGALLLNGQVFQGAHGSAGEVGHVVIDQDGPLCGCSRHGCLEALASRTAVASQASVLAIRGDAPNLLADAGTNPVKIRSAAIARAIKAGDTALEQVVRRAGRHIGWVVSGLVNFLDPDAIVLGGGMVEAMPILISEEVRKMIDQHALPVLAKQVKVVASSFGDDAVCLGAAKIAADLVQLTAQKKRKKRS